jgi:hypothetical protein
MKDEKHRKEDDKEYRMHYFTPQNINSSQSNTILSSSMELSPKFTKILNEIGR